MTDSPWYKRSEFWLSLLTTLLGVFAQKSGNPTVQSIGAALGGASPIAYTLGRSSIKTAAQSNCNVIK